MTVTLLVSPPATGKTTECIRRVQGVLRERSLSTLWVVVPDRLQAVAFRHRLAVAGGAIAAQVGTFGDLYREILHRAGQPVPLLSGPVLLRLVRAAVRDVQNQGSLVHYAPIADKPGFIHALRDRFAELKRAQVQPETLLAQVASQGRDLHELAQIYTAYQTRLQKLGWADPEGLNWLAVEALQKNPSLVSDWALLVVDGFDDFNGSQISVLQLLGETLPQVLITLPGTFEMERRAHRRFRRSLNTLTSALHVKIESLTETPYLPAPLTHLEQGLFEAASSPMAEAAGHVELLEARSPQEEVREALRWTKARIVRSKVLSSDCAILTPDLDLYRPHLQAAALEFGLTLRFSRGESLESAPGTVALLDLLELPLRSFPRRLTLEAIRTPYLDLAAFGLTPRDADTLDAVSRYGQVIAGLEQWEEAFIRLTGATDTASPGEDEEGRPQDLVHGHEAEELWHRLLRFAQRLQTPGSQATRDWVRWLEDLLDDLRFFDGEWTERDRASSAGFREALRALVLSEGIVGEVTQDYAGFLAELHGALVGINLQQPSNWSHPAIQVLETLEARGVRYRAVAVLGLAEGLIPRVEREDPFFGEDLRRELDLEPRLIREQEGIFYQMITRADTYLLLTRPYLAEEGEPWEPSPYWTAVDSLFTEKPRRVRMDNPRPMVDAASSEESLFWAVRRRSLPSRMTEELMPRWQHLRQARDHLSALQAKQASEVSEVSLTGLSAWVGDHFGPEHVWSPSRLESYGTCPYRFFLESVLNLESKEPPEAGFDAQQLGSMLHAILERAYGEADDPSDPVTVLPILRELAEAEFDAAPEKYGFRPTALWTVEREQLLDKLVETVCRLAEVGGDWTPIAFEASFGREGVPPLVLEVDGESIQLRGVIDRVDRNREGSLRVVDYKTGSSHLSPQDLIEGRRLQLPLYALAARDALGLGEPVEGLYWTILAGKAGSLKLSTFHHEDYDRQRYHGPSGAVDIALSHVQSAVRGVRAGVFTPTPPRGGCPEYCTAKGWCWRYVPSRW